MNTYIKFLKESAGIPKPQDATARVLFEIICLNDGLGHPMTVNAAMSQRSIASPATLHRKLDDLLELGLIQHEYQGKNRRTKYLKMSTGARLYTTLMSQAMERAMQ